MLEDAIEICKVSQIYHLFIEVADEEKDGLLDRGQGC